ncbi:MAG: gliding motility-associated C-terminal domain-containing protein, partial [Flavobacteriales bacterium]|nr:gliding motility-associated C-terminal domain-containing protein [Flavobacteriales bacterium]
GTAVLEAWSDDDVNGTWTYTWDNGLGVGSSVNVSPAVTTTYTVFATDDNGCDADPLEVEVEVREPLSVEIDGPTMLCAGVNSQFEVTNSSGGLAPYTYDWTYNGQAIGSGDMIDYQAAITGDYCVTISDACETPAVTACALLEIEQAIPVVFESDTTVACNPASIQFTSLVDETLYNSSLWNFGDGTGSSELNPAHGYGNPGLYDVSLQIVSNFGCTYNAEIQNMISILPAPQVGYDATPQPATVPDTEIQFFDASANDVVAYYWVFDTLNVLGTSTAQNPVFQFPYDVGGYYPVSLTVMDANNCTSTLVRTIVVNDLFNLFIPNAFSPNNDGINDIFRIEGTDIDASRFKLQVFDRWGGIVFETTDPEVGWNGSYQTVNEEYYAQDGIYAWRVVVHSQSTTERKEFSGSVNLMR